VLVGAGAQFGLDALRAFQHPSGFESAGRLSFRVALPWAKYDVRTGDTTRFYDQLGTRLAALPGVDHVAWSSRLPATADNAAAGTSTDLEIRLPEAPDVVHALRPQSARISEGFFAAAGIPLLAGRDFNTDDQPGTAAVAIVSQALATRLWPARDPIGVRLMLPTADGSLQTVAVVGVVGDARFDLNAASAPPMIYLPVRQRPDANLYLLLAHRGPAPTAAQLRSTMVEVDPAQSLYEIASLGERRDRQLWQPKLMGQLLAVFAAAAWVLVAVGIAGLSRLWATQRRRDLALRAALGANAQRLYRESLSEVLRVLGLGIVMGLPLLGALLWSSQRILLLPGQHSVIVLPLLGAALLAALLLAALPAARSAAACEPAEALR
jgi:putative ABC transport system permease protein